MNKQRKEIGLALGSGGSRGLAHIGVIKELHRHNIPIDIIVGASIGALVGGLYAVDTDVEKLESIAVTVNWKQVLPMFFDPAIGQGILKGDKFKKFIKAYVGDTTFESVKVPFGAVVTDLSDAKAVCLTTGDYATALRASMSLPLLLRPVVINGKVCVDGGLSMPVPVEFARALGADIVLAVNLFEHYEGIMIDQKFGINTVTYKSSDVLSHYLALENVRTADVIVGPKVTGATLFNKFMTEKGTREIIQAGQLAMRKQIPLLQELLRQEKEEQPERKKSLLHKFLNQRWLFGK